MRRVGATKDPDLDKESMKNKRNLRCKPDSHLVCFLLLPIRMSSVFTAHRIGVMDLFCN